MISINFATNTHWSIVQHDEEIDKGAECSETLFHPQRDTPGHVEHFRQWVPVTRSDRQVCPCAAHGAGEERYETRVELHAMKRG